MGRIVIVAYRPKPGCAEQLKQLALTHVDRLRDEGLATDRAPVLLESSDGTIVEVFEWESKEAIEAAHQNATVQAMWREFAEVCDFVPVGQLKECDELFSEFTPLQ